MSEVCVSEAGRDLASAEGPERPTGRSHDERGQATAEYALLTGAIAVVIAAVTAWAAGTGKIGRLLDVVFDHLARGVG